MHPVPLATGEVADLLLLIRAAEIERGGVRARVARSRTDQDVLLATRDLLPHVLVRVERVAGLRDARELHGLTDREGPAVRHFLAGDQETQARLPAAVGADDTE